MTELMLLAMNIDWAAVAIQQLPVVIAVLLGAFARTLCRWAWAACRWMGIAARGLPRKAVRRCASAVQWVNNFVFRRKEKPKPESGYAARRQKQQMAKHRPTSVTIGDATKAFEAFGRAVGRMARPDAPAFYADGELAALASGATDPKKTRRNLLVDDVMIAIKDDLRQHGFEAIKIREEVYNHNDGIHTLILEVVDVQMGK